MIRKPPIPPPCDGAPGLDLAKIQHTAITKMMARIGNAYRSNACTRLCPKNAITSWISTMITRQSHLGRWVSVFSANVPLTLFTANQPIPAVIEFSPAGSAFPQ